MRLEHMHLLGGLFRRVTRIGVATAIVIAVGSPASPASATSVDRGWTQNLNGNYPASTSNPACSTCVAHSAYPSPFYFYQPSSYMHADLVTAASRWNAVASTNSPLLTEHVIADNTVGIWVGRKSMGAGICGWTVLFGQDGVHPQDTASWNNFRITGADLSLNTNKLYSNSGNFGPTVCEVRNVWLHELGHALGLGHTTNTGQVMRTANAPIYVPATGDVHGLQCFYDSNTSACSANP
jgi:hypothetical protein